MAKAGTPAAKTAKDAKGPAAKGGTAAYETLIVEIRDAVARVALARPDVHNAFNDTLIGELDRALAALDADDAVRAVILLGQGKSFSAGADLNWMKRMAALAPGENLADAMAMARMLARLRNLSKPTIARVHGAAFGGGVGLVACCDIAVAAQDATFSLSEVKLGLIPATISPYVVEAIGVRHARRYFVSAERFDAAEAYRIGLVHDLALLEELDGKINEILGSLLTAGPKSQAAAKELIRAVAHQAVDEHVMADTAERIAAIRGTAEAKEGVAAFLDKRDASWVPAALRKK
jgi:methylglutaconyl-CoA hydratase